jgi:hypothetical protein
MRKSLSEFFRSNTQVVQEDDERESDNVDDIHSLEERILQKVMFFSGQVMVNNKLTHKKKTFPPNNKRQTYPIFDEMDEIDEVDDAGRGGGGGGGGGEKRKGNIFWTKLKNSFQKKNNQTTTSSPTVHIHGKKTQSTNLQSLDNQFNGPSTNEFPPPAAYLPAVVGVRRRSRSRTSSFGSDSAASDADAICGSMRLDVPLLPPPSLALSTIHYVPLFCCCYLTVFAHKYVVALSIFLFMCFSYSQMMLI